MEYFLCPHTSRKYERIFLCCYLRKLGWAPGSKIPKWVRVPDDWVSLEFLALKIVHAEPSAIHLVQFRFSCPGVGSCRDCMLVTFCASKLWFSVYTCVFNTGGAVLGQWFALWPHCLAESKRSWFFSLVSFLLVRIKWWLSAAYMLDWRQDVLSFSFPLFLFNKHLPHIWHCSKGFTNMQSLSPPTNTMRQMLLLSLLFVLLL